MLNELHNESQQYNLVITGKVCSGYKKDLAAKNLSVALNISLNKSASLLRGESICIKHKIDKQTASKYMRALQEKGIESRVEPCTPPPHQSTQQQQQQQRQTVAQKTTKKTRDTAAPTPAIKPVSAPAQRQKTAATQPTGTPTPTPLRPAQTSKAKDIRPDETSTAARFTADVRLKKLPAGVYAHLLVTSALLTLVSMLYLSLGCAMVLFLIERTVNLVINGSTISLANFIFLYTLPLLLCSFLLVLYARPLFPKNRELTGWAEAGPQQQPELFTFIKQICEKLQVSPPSRCFFNTSPTVSTSVERDFSALKLGHIQLHLGLNLFQTLSASQLAGVIASRLWHFREARSKHLFGLVMFVHERSFNATFNKDGWLDWIHQRQDTSQNMVGDFILSLIQACLSVSSLIFMFFHLLITLFDAGLQKRIQRLTDECAALFAGSEDYKKTFLLAKRAQHAQSEVLRKMLNSPGPLRLVNDLPSLIGTNLRGQPAKIVEILNDDMLSEQPSWYHNRATINDRMVWVENLDLSPGLEANFKSLALLNDYGRLSEQVSMIHYESEDIHINTDELVDLSAFIESTKQEEARLEKVKVYFNGTFQQSVFWLFPVAKMALKLKPKRKAALLNDAIARLRKGTPDYLSVQQQLPILRDKMRALTIANEIRKAGYRIPIEYFDSKKNERNFADQFNAVKNQYIENLQATSKFCELMGLRTLLAVSLSSKKEDAYLGYRIVELLRELYRLHSRLEKLQMAVSFLPIAETRARDKKEANHHQRIQKIFRDVLVRSDDVFHRLRQHKWPLDGDFITAEDYILSHTQRLAIEEEYSVATIVDYYQKIMLAMEVANVDLNSELSSIAFHYENLYKINRLKVIAINQAPTKTT